MYAFWSYWYLQSATRFYEGCLAAIGSVEDEVAVIDTARNITKPLFQDYTRQGRVLGVLFRAVRIGIGVLMFGFVIIGYSLIYLFWLMMPLLCLVSLIGSVFGDRG